MGQHVPSRPTWLHVMQAPLQATLQQTPSAQNPEAQSAFAAHTAPRGLGPQLPLTHFTPPVQSPSLAHVEKHLFVLVSQSKGAHTVAGPGLHRPAPSQTLTLPTDAPSQVPALQTVPDAYLRQAPAPLHVPSSPHVEASDLGQTLGERGGSPLGTNEQVPGDCGVLHDLHASPHELLQQTPSMQNPLWQSPAQPHAWPLGRRMPFVPVHAVTGPASPPSGPPPLLVPPQEPSARMAPSRTAATHP
jgi:hypothetical protein